MTTTDVPLRLVRHRVTATDGWCDSCALPSRVSVEALVHVGPLPLHDSRMSYWTMSQCVDCGSFAWGAA